MQHDENRKKAAGKAEASVHTSDYSLDAILKEARALREGEKGAKNPSPKGKKPAQKKQGAPNAQAAPGNKIENAAPKPPKKAEETPAVAGTSLQSDSTPAEQEEKLYFESSGADVDFSGLAGESSETRQDNGKSFFKNFKRRLKQKREEKGRDELIERYQHDPIKPMSEAPSGKYTGEVEPTFGYLFDDGEPSEEPQEEKSGVGDEFSSVFDKLMVEKRRQTVEQLFEQVRPGDAVPHHKRPKRLLDDIDTDTIVFEIDDADLGKTTQFSVIREEDLALFADGEIPSEVIEEPAPVPPPAKEDSPAKKEEPAADANETGAAPQEAVLQNNEQGPPTPAEEAPALQEPPTRHPKEEAAAPPDAFEEPAGAREGEAANPKSKQEESPLQSGENVAALRKEEGIDNGETPQSADTSPAGKELSSPFIDDLRPQNANEGVAAFPTDKRVTAAENAENSAKVQEGEASPSQKNTENSPQKKPTISRYEQHFGKPAPVPKRAEEKGASPKKKKAGKKAPLYRKEGEKMLVVVGKFEDTLLDECAQSSTAAESAAPPARKKKGKKARRGEKQPAKENVLPLPQQERAEPDAQQEKRRRFHLFGDVEEENDELDEPKRAEEEELSDYTDPSDILSVRSDLFVNTRRLFVRLLATGLLAAAAVAFAVVSQLDVAFLRALKADSPAVIPIVQLALLLICGAFSYVTIASGLRSLFRLRPNSDSALAFAAATAAIQAFAAIFVSTPFVTGQMHIYASLAVLGLFLNTWGKFLMVRRAGENFKFVSSPDQKRAVRILGDEKLSEEMYRGLDSAAPVIAYQTRVKFLNDFLKLSYEPDSCERLAAKAAPFGVLLSLLVGVLSFFLVSRDWLSALSAFTVTSLMCVPMCALLCFNRPLFKLCKKALKKGAMLIGAPGVRQFCDTTAVVLRDTDLYPGGSVKLHGIKTFSGNRIDEVILDAAALMKEVGGPIASTFDDIIKGKKEILPKVDSVGYEDGKGLVGWVRTRRTLIGNRNLMLNHGITPPSLDYEEKYRKGGRQITYLASAGDLVAMFITSYTPSPSMVYELEEMEDHGVNFLIQTRDSNITDKFVAAQFGVYIKSVRILPDKLSEEFEETTQNPDKKVRGYLAARLKSNAMTKLITACIRMKSSMTTALVLQAVAVIADLLLAVFLVFCAGLSQLGAMELLICQAFWVLAILVVPMLRKPM